MHVCGFRLSPRLAVAVKMLPPPASSSLLHLFFPPLSPLHYPPSLLKRLLPGTPGSAAPADPPLLSTPAGATSALILHCRQPLLLAAAAAAAHLSAPLSPRSHRDASPVRSDSLLGFFLLFFFSFFLLLARSLSLSPLPTPLSSLLFCSSKGTCCVEVTLSRPQLQSQPQRKEVGRGREREREHFSRGWGKTGRG